MFERRLPEGQGQNLALTVLYVPWLSYMCHDCLACAGTTPPAPAPEQRGKTFKCFNDAHQMAKARKMNSSLSEGASEGAKDDLPSLEELAWKKATTCESRPREVTHEKLTKFYSGIIAQKTRQQPATINISKVSNEKHA